MVAIVSKPTSSTPEPAGIVLHGISWDTYQTLVRELESQPNKRMTYDSGLLEIVMPLPPHESYKRWTGRLVEILTEELDIEIRSLSACTWSRKDLAKGVEADECYYIQNEAAVRGRMNIDLSVDPPPDLAIEIDMTNPSIPRLPIYQALGVPEVWRFDGTKMTLLSLIEGEYAEITQSIALPLVTAGALENWLEQAKTMGETSWAKSIRRWVQEINSSN